MAKREHLSLRMAAPVWLTDIVSETTHRPWAHRLAVALDLEVDGHGASAGLELSAFVLDLYGKALGSKELITAAQVPNTMAAAARASVNRTMLADQNGLPSDSTSLILERLNTRLRGGGAGSHGTAIAVSTLLRDAIRSGHRIRRSAVQRLSSMAGACQADSLHPDRDRWRALAAQQPFELRALERFIREHGTGEPVALARTLHQALNNVAPIPMPAEVAATAGRDVAGPRPLSFAPNGAPEETPEDTTVATGPSWAALHAAASHAGMAESFSLELDHQRIDVNQLSLIGAACRKALRGPTDDPDIDLALLQSMAEVLNHDHDTALDLALTPGSDDDTWYCVELRCLIQDRRARRGLSTDAGRREWESVYVYPEACDRIEHLLRQTPDAKRLRHLTPHRGQAEFVQATAAWVKLLTDAAHPATPGRAVHSTCLAYLKAGATDVETEMMARAPAAASGSAGNYYAPRPHRHHQLACAAFELLGRERPQPIAPSPLLSPRDVPDDDDFRAEWLMLRDLVRSLFEAMDTASIAEVADLLTAGMAACRKIYELLTAARDQVRQHPRWIDLAQSDQWHFDSDKDTPINSDRLLAITPELQELIRVARLLRQKGRDRLRSLGVTGDAMPAALVTMTPDSSLFCKLKALPTSSGLRLVVGVLNDELMVKLKQNWSGPRNMGRRYWVGQAAERARWLDEQALTGHGRGLRHMGSHCLSVSVQRLLDSAKVLVTDTLARLALPAFGEGIAGTPEPIVVPIDLRSVDRRRDRGTRPTDMPQHHTEWRTPGFMAVVDRLRPCVGQDGGLSSAARALLALIVAQGLCHSADVREAWRSLREQWRKKGSVWIDWLRDSGQPIEMPLLAPVRLAADEVENWPSLAEAEAELREWLGRRNAAHPLRPVLWPSKPGATITGLCWLMSHWVRVHVGAFLALSYDPDQMAATLDRRSLDLLQHREAAAKTLKLGAFRSRLAKVLPAAMGKDSLLWIQTEVGSVAKSGRRLGERQKRAGKVQQALADRTTVMAASVAVDHAGETKEQRSERWARTAVQVDELVLKVALRTVMSPVGQMLLVYLDMEAVLARARDPDANAPGTWYDYLSAVRKELEALWPKGAEPTQIVGRRWRKITRRILARQPGDTDITHDTRRKAWRRILEILSANPAYAEAAAALDEPGTPSRPARYIPAAASALWPRRRLPAIQAGVAELLRGEPLAWPQAMALLSLLLDAGPRRSEACGIRLEDLAEDGTWVQRFPSGYGRKKTRLAIGRSLLKPQTAAEMRDLRALMRSLHPPPAYFFSESESDDSLAYAQTLLDVIVDVARDKIGSELVVIHGGRGSAAMDMLVPGWEGRFEALAAAPFQLADAQAIVAAMERDGPDHMAHVLCSISHASHKTFARRYCTCWPLLYAASMRALLADVELDAKLIRKMPHLATDEDRDKAIVRRRRAKGDTPAGTPFDDWDWPLKHHYAKRKPGPNPKQAKAAPGFTLVSPAGNGASSALRPAELPVFGDLLNYLIRRHLGLGTAAAARHTHLDIDVARWLDKSECAPPAAPVAPEVESSDDAQKKASTNSLTFALNQLKSPHGQGLVAAIAAASPMWLPMAELLRDSHMAPPVTTDLVVRVRDLLPTTLAVHLALSVEYFATELAKSLDGLERVHLDSSTNVERGRPRVRVMPTQLTKSGDVLHQHAAVLTYLATLALSICPSLSKLIK